MRLATDGDLALLHGFKQGALHFGRRPVDFVCQHEVGEDGPLLDRELLRLLVVHERAYHVGREQVRCELHAAEVSRDSVAQALDGQSFGQSGNAFEQHMSVGQQANEQAVHHVGLADNRSSHLRAYGVHKVAFLCNACIQRLDVRGTTGLVLHDRSSRRF